MLIFSCQSNGGRIRNRISIRETKTGESKDFPIDDTARKAILEYLATRSYTFNDPLFLSRKGSHALKRQQVYKIINDGGKNYRDKRKHWHTHASEDPRVPRTSIRSEFDRSPEVIQSLHSKCHRALHRYYTG